MRLHQHVRHAYPAAEGWLLTRTTDRLKGVDFARRALEAAGDDPGVLANDTWQRRDFGSGKLALDSWHRPIFDISCGGGCAPSFSDRSLFFQRAPCQKEELLTRRSAWQRPSHDTRRVQEGVVAVIRDGVMALRADLLVRRRQRPPISKSQIGCDQKSRIA